MREESLQFNPKSQTKPFATSSRLNHDKPNNTSQAERERDTGLGKSWTWLSSPPHYEISNLLYTYISDEEREKSQ